MRTVDVVGAGPAGSAAALAALAAGAPVRLFEKSALPRHRVCGEFLSPGIDTVLDRLGAWDGFARLAPARIARAVLSFNGREVRFPLPRPAYGLSRFALDKMLADLAVSRGAEFHREAVRAGHVIAHGRLTPAPRGRRLFGFKAHFAGPADDAVRLFFFGGCYAGVSAIEGGLTNVCGLAPEDLLRGGRFQPETVVELSRGLGARIAPLRRVMDWIITGPLVFRAGFRDPAVEGIYPAGDALGFVDPFTGSGVLCALITGRMAGRAAAEGTPARDYLRDCTRMLGREYRAAGLFRAALRKRLAEALAPLVPGALLFRLTRPGLGD